MIKAKELRLGNKVKVFDDIVVVTAIDDDGILDTTAYFDGQKGCCGCTEEVASGIPLTPEILEKCGFVEKETINSDGDECSWQQLHIQDGRNFLTYYWGKLDLHDARIDLSHIKYLHQLQNYGHCADYG